MSSQNPVSWQESGHPGAWQAPRELSPGADGWRRLALAQRSGDGLAMATASAALARRCLAERDLEEARFHLQRARQILGRSGAGNARLLLQCELVELLLVLAQLSTLLSERDSARLLAEEARDAGYDVVRDCAVTSDAGTRATALRRVADCLDALGDAGDALALRAQALHGPAPGRAKAAGGAPAR